MFGAAEIPLPASVLDLKFACFWIDLGANFKSKKHARDNSFLVS